MVKSGNTSPPLSPRTIHCRTDVRRYGHVVMVANAALAPATDDVPLLVELALEVGSGFAESQSWTARALCVRDWSTRHPT